MLIDAMSTRAPYIAFVGFLLEHVIIVFNERMRRGHEETNYLYFLFSAVGLGGSGS